MVTGIPSGLSAQFMTSEESAYGTPVTPDRAFEFLQESLQLTIERMESSALRRGTRLQRSDRWATGKRSVAGDVTMELSTMGFGRWWKHALGGVVTSQPAAGPSPTVYKHTFTPGDLPVGQTIQVGRPDTAGTIQPFTYHGCMIAGWTLECSVGGFATFGATILGRDGTVGTTLAEPSYAVGNELLTFVSGALTVGGSPMDVKSFAMQGSNALTEERFFLGSALRKAPQEIGMRAITGNLEPEFTSLAAYNAFVAGSEAELELLFQGDIIEDALRFEHRITANVRYDGGTPNVGGPQTVMNPLPYKVVDDGTQSIEIVYQTTDTTP